MKVTSTIAMVAGLVASVNAHTQVFGVSVNGVSQGDGRGVYVRSPPSNSPIKDVTNPAIECNVNNVAVPKKVVAKAGDKLTFKWFHNTPGAGDDCIDPSHLGPIMHWIAPLSSNGNGAVWSKLAETGFENGKWAVQTLIANGCEWTITIPPQVKAGDYLIKGEIIALHEADTNFRSNNARGAQFYPSCSQFTITGGGNAVPDENFNFIGGYTPTGPGILFNLYSGFTSYPFPGPNVWVPTSSGSPAPAPAPKPITSKPAAVKPKPTTVPKPPVHQTVQPKPTTMVTSTRAKGHHSTGGHHHHTVKPTPPASAGQQLVGKWGQCGGKNWTGGKACASGSTCKFQNDYYSQCL